MASLLRKVAQFLYAGIKGRLSALFDPFDPVRSSPVRHQQKIYAVFLCIFICSYLLGIVGLGGEKLAFGTLSQFAVSFKGNPLPFNHQIFPPVVWPYSDYIQLISFSAMVGVCLVMILYDEPIKSEYWISPDNANIIQADFHAIAELRGKIKAIFRLQVGTFTFGYLEFLFNAYINGYYTFTLFSLFFWLTCFPVIVLGFTYIGNLVHFQILQLGAYIDVLQRSFEARFREGLAKAAKRRRGRRPNAGAIWTTYLTFNRQYLFICRLIDAYSAHYWPLLTLVYVYTIGLQCYTCFVVLMYVSIPFLYRSTLAVGTLSMGSLLFIDTHFLASVAKNNGRILKINYQYYGLLQGLRAYSLTYPCHLLKAESFHNSRRLRCYAFSLFGNYRITSKSFYMIISYTSIFFLFIIKDSYK